MTARNYCLLSGAIFILVALAHLARIVGGTPVYVDELPIPMWLSWFGTVVPAALGVWALRIAGQTN